MSIFLIGAALLAGSGYSVTPLDGGRHIILTSTRPAGESKNVRCRWTVCKDAVPMASGNWTVSELGMDAPITNSAPPILRGLQDEGCDLALRIRFVTGEEDPRKETLLAMKQIDYPRTKARALSAYAGKPAELTESADTYEFKTPSQRIRFDRGTGLLSGFATGWWSLTEWFKRPMAFDFGDSAPNVRMESFSKPTETNGVWSFKTVSWWTMGGRGKDSASAKNFELRVTTDWQVRGDGRVVSLSTVRPFGLRHVLPRVGWAFVLAPDDLLVQYYGIGPAADAKDRSHEGLAGLYSASVAGCGPHEKVRGVAFDAGSDHFAISTLGDDFSLEVAPTASKATFCGAVVARDVETDRDWHLNFLISPEKTLKAMAPPEEARTRDARFETGTERQLQNPVGTAFHRRPRLAVERQPYQNREVLQLPPQTKDERQKTS